MTRKRWLYLVVAVLCVVGLLVSGCGPAEEEGEEPPAEEEGWVAPIPGMKPGEEDLYFEWQATSGGRSLTFGWDMTLSEYLWEKIEEETEGHLKLTAWNWGYAVAGALEAETVIGANVVQVGSSIPPYHPVELPLPGIYCVPQFMGADLMQNQILGEYSVRHPLAMENWSAMNLYPYIIGVYFPTILMVRKGYPTKITKLEQLEDLNMLSYQYCSYYTTNVNANPVMIPINEVYEGMQKGILDVAVVADKDAEKWKYAEVSEFVIDWSLMGQGSVPVVNLDAWNSLPQYLKDIILSDEIQDWYAQLSADECTLNSERGRDCFEEAGVEIYKLDPEEEKRWLLPSDPAWRAYVEDSEKVTRGKKIREFVRDCLTYREELFGEEWPIYMP